jgi:GPH family glycoside/pentoside/hexuronide:cation symporter
MFVILWLSLAGGVAKWFIYTPKIPFLLLFDSILSGPIWVALYIAVPSMLADLCDVDEYQYGGRREGVFGAVFTWMQKCGSSLTFLVSGAALSLSGFDKSFGADQPEGTVLIMRLAFAGSSVLAVLACMIFLSFYNVSERQAYEIRARLEARRGKA